eukprot:scaffold18079_cov65-Phaeocystis_antarctica.AAC.2
MGFDFVLGSGSKGPGRRPKRQLCSIEAVAPRWQDPARGTRQRQPRDRTEATTWHDRRCGHGRPRAAHQPPDRAAHAWAAAGRHLPARGRHRHRHEPRRHAAPERPERRRRVGGWRVCGRAVQLRAALPPHVPRPTRRPRRRRPRHAPAALRRVLRVERRGGGGAAARGAGAARGRRARGARAVRRHPVRHSHQLCISELLCLPGAA